MNRILPIFIITCTFNAFLIAEDSLRARRPALGVTRDRAAKTWSLTASEPGIASPKTIFRSNLSLDYASWSSDGSYLAFIVNGDFYSNWDENQKKWIDGDVGQKLVIMNRGYKQVAEFADIRRYCWSPHGNRLAMIAGQAVEVGLGFTPDKMVVYDVDTKTQLEMPSTAYDLCWAKHDNIIYIATFTEKVAFDPVRKSKIDILYHGIYFSDDGEYYYDPSWEGSEFGIYRTVNNERLTPPGSLLNREFLHPYGWLEDSHCLVIWDYDSKKSHIVNVETGKSVTVDAQPLGQIGAVVRRNEWNDPEFCADTAMLESLK